MADKYRISCLEGDGISAELIASSVVVLDALAPYFIQPVELMLAVEAGRTDDLGGTLDCSGFTKQLIQRLKVG